MFPLIPLVIFGIAIILFVIQNSQIVPIILFNYHLSGVPIYALVLISLFLGFVVSWLMNFIGLISSTFKIRSREKAIKNANKQVTELIKKINQLKLENKKLKDDRYLS